MPRQTMGLYSDPNFKATMQTLFQEEPTGRLLMPAARDLLDRIADLEGRTGILEGRARV